MSRHPDSSGPVSAMPSGNGSPAAHTAPSMKVSFFQIGYGLFEGIDEPAAGVEGLGAMSGCDHDEHAGLADLQAAEAMNQA